jgi:hypothetical protein
MDQFVEYRGLPDDPAIAALVLVGHLAVDENGISMFVLSVSFSDYVAIDLDQRPLAPCTCFNGSIFASTPFDKSLPPFWNCCFEGVGIQEVDQVLPHSGKA